MSLVAYTVFPQFFLYHLPLAWLIPASVNVGLVHLTCLINRMWTDQDGCTDFKRCFGSAFCASAMDVKRTCQESNTGQNETSETEEENNLYMELFNHVSYLKNHPLLRKQLEVFHLGAGRELETQYRRKVRQISNVMVVEITISLMSYLSCQAQGQPAQNGSYYMTQYFLIASVILVLLISDECILTVLNN